MDKIINKDYILSLKNSNGLLEIEQNPIVQPEDILNKLDNLEENASDYTAFYIQNYANSLSIKKDSEYSFCWPKLYRDSFVPLAKFPEEIDRAKYNKELEKVEDKAKIQFAHKYTNDAKRRNRIYLPDYEEKLKETIQKKKLEFERNETIKQIGKLRRYILAQSYAETLEKIKLISLVYSCEKIGWYKPHFNISGFARISLSTNFCYGRAAYFHVNLNYKGINILPYSDLVKYYWSNMEDDIRYTRLYYPDRYNWNEVMEFIRDTCNWINRDNVSFEKKWIVEEIEKMMMGLKTINEEIDKYYEQLVEAKQIDTEKRLDMKKKGITPKDTIVHRLIDDDIIWNNKVYPHEARLTIQVDKLSAALSLLEDLIVLRNIYEPVLSHKDTIVQYNAKVISAIDVTCKEIRKKIAELKRKEKNVGYLIKRKQFEIEKRKRELDKALEKANFKYKDHFPQSLFRVMELEKECLNDGKYNKLQNELSEHHQTLSKLCEEEQYRQKFFDHLTERKEYIVGRLEKWQKNNT